MKQEQVWISRAMQESTLMKDVTCDEIENDSDHAVDAMRRNKNGEPLPPDRFPKKMRLGLYDKKLKRLPDMSLAGGFWVVSSECADVLSQFELGQSSLYPTEIFRFDGKTPLDGSYFHLNFGEVKNAFVPEETPGVRVASPLPNPKPTGYWNLPGALKNGQVALNQTALDGPDLWMDRSLPYTFFLSGDLVAALKAAKLTKRLSLRKCRVIGK